MNARRLEQFVIAGVAVHSLILGVAMLFFPVWTLAQLGWVYDGPPFFPAQSGIFLLILGGAYLVGVWRRSFAWLLVASKAVAVVFLIGGYCASFGPAMLLLAAFFDGLMGLAVAGAVLWSGSRQKTI